MPDVSMVSKRESKDEIASEKTEDLSPLTYNMKKNLSRQLFYQDRDFADCNDVLDQQFIKDHQINPNNQVCVIPGSQVHPKQLGYFKPVPNTT